MGSCGAHIRSPIWRFGACSGRLAIPTLSTNRMGQHSTRFFQLMTTSTASRPGLCVRSFVHLPPNRRSRPQAAFDLSSHILGSLADVIGLSVTSKLVVFGLLSLFDGLFTVIPQVLNPLAVDLAPPEARNYQLGCSTPIGACCIGCFRITRRRI